LTKVEGAGCEAPAVAERKLVQIAHHETVVDVVRGERPAGLEVVAVLVAHADLLRLGEGIGALEHQAL
jgi:hypothetical protein